MRTSRYCLLASFIVLLAAFNAAAKTGGAKAAPGKGKYAKALPLSALEGEWKVVSSTWGGDPADFAGVIYDLKIQKGSIFATAGAATQFVATLTSVNGGFVSSINGDTPFCVQRYTDKPDSYSLYQGYSYLTFWRPKEYPCGELDEAEAPDKNDPNSIIGIPVSRYMIRFDLASATRAHAILYYEGGVYAVTTEQNKSAIENSIGNDENNKLKAKCAGGLCYIGGTGWTGIFELELVKVKKGK